MRDCSAPEPPHTLGSSRPLHAAACITPPPPPRAPHSAWQPARLGRLWGNAASCVRAAQLTVLPYPHALPARATRTQHQRKAQQKSKQGPPTWSAALLADFTASLADASTAAATPLHKATGRGGYGEGGRVRAACCVCQRHASGRAPSGVRGAVCSGRSAWWCNAPGALTPAGAER